MFDGGAINLIRVVQQISFPDEKQSMLCCTGSQTLLMSTISQKCHKITTN